MSNSKKKKAPVYTNVRFLAVEGPGATGRYLQRIVGEVNRVDHQGKKLRKIGQLQGYKLLLNAACRAHKPCEPLIKLADELYGTTNPFYDFKEGEFLQAISDRYANLDYSHDLLVLTRVEVIPEFRGTEIGRDAVLEFYRHFSSGCRVVAARCLPGQFDHKSILLEDKQWRKRIQYETFGKFRHGATLALQRYFLGIGFDYLPDISEEYLFMNPAFDDMYAESSKFV